MGGCPVCARRVLCMKKVLHACWMRSRSCMVLRTAPDMLASAASASIALTACWGPKIGPSSCASGDSVSCRLSFVSVHYFAEDVG